MLHAIELFVMVINIANANANVNKNTLTTYERGIIIQKD